MISAPGFAASIAAWIDWPGFTLPSEAPAGSTGTANAPAALTAITATITLECSFMIPPAALLRALDARASRDSRDNASDESRVS